MSKFPALSMFFAAVLAIGVVSSAAAQEQPPSPHQVQSMIAAGQTGQALQDLKAVLAQHPQSGIAWYLAAEAQDASGNEAAAAQALAKADQYAPGLPFANAQAVQALRTHINNGLESSGEHHATGGVSIVLLVIVALIALFVLLRMVAGWGRRAPMNTPYPSNPNMPFSGGYGAGGPFAGGGMGGGLGSSIITGLAAGAGFAAGERVIDGLMGGNQAQAAPDFGQQNFPGPQDDGLSGDPGWGSGDDGLGGGNSW